MNSTKLYGGIDPLEAVLYLNAKYTLLPELFEVFGHDNTMKFLELFGGKTLKVPPVLEMQKAFDYLGIWSSLRKSNNPTTVKRLCKRYEMSYAEVREAYRRVQDMFNAQQKRFKQAAEEAVEAGRGAAGDIETQERDVDITGLYGTD